jgi:hypothetical protein
MLGSTSGARTWSRKLERGQVYDAELWVAKDSADMMIFENHTECIGRPENLR